MRLSLFIFGLTLSFIAVTLLSGFQAVADETGPCNPDIRAFCKEAKTKMEIVTCLYDEHGDEISADCKESLERHQQLNKNWIKACAQEMGSLCRGVKPEPGKEPMVDCLWDHERELNPDCLEALEAHRAGKLSQ